MLSREGTGGASNSMPGLEEQKSSQAGAGGIGVRGSRDSFARSIEPCSGKGFPLEHGFLYGVEVDPVSSRNRFSKMSRSRTALARFLSCSGRASRASNPLRSSLSWIWI